MSLTLSVWCSQPWFVQFCAHVWFEGKCLLSLHSWNVIWRSWEDSLVLVSCWFMCLPLSAWCEERQWRVSGAWQFMSLQSPLCWPWVTNTMWHQGGGDNGYTDQCSAGVTRQKQIVPSPTPGVWINSCNLGLSSCWDDPESWISLSINSSHTLTGSMPSNHSLLQHKLRPSQSFSPYNWCSLRTDRP